MIIPFRKYHGTGNDFVMIDNRKLSWSAGEQDVALLCDRHTGIGADGLILLSNSSKGDFFMRYFNSDGRESTMCGNGGRCIAAFAHSLGLTHEHAHFEAVDGMHEAVLTGGDENVMTVRLRMKDVTVPSDFSEDNMFLNTGSPHFLIRTEDPAAVDLVGEARKIRYSEHFREEGTNVNFFRIDGDRLFVRTYERGVEDETLSCGTGVTASALAAAILSGKRTGTYAVGTRGGMLSVSFIKEQDTFTHIWLEGPAAFVFEGSIHL